MEHNTISISKTANLAKSAQSPKSAGHKKSPPERALKILAITYQALLRLLMCAITSNSEFSATSSPSLPSKVSN
jgi:hypothetical protein